jgi:glycerophosphoryl diester phosphodiesterase
VIVGNGNVKRPRTVGHRGASALAPENTLRAFEVAIEHGLDLAELDVHLSRDGQLVVIHDNVLPRPDGRPVGELTAEELERVDVGDGQGVPRLVEVFELARGRLGLYVELKGPGTGEALGRLVQTGAAEGVEVTGGSFRPEEVGALRGVAPDLPRSVLFGRTGMEEMLRACAELETTYVHPCFRPVDQEMIDRFHAAGLQVMTPHTNEPDEARAFARLGVDVIASDDPRILIGLVGPG